MSKIALFKTKSFQLLFIIALVVGIGISFAVDTDNDGMSDLYEGFFKLNPSNSTDAVENHDGDLLDNLAEFGLWTNPNVSDTDLDGFPDHADSNALSRAVVFWGHPDFTSGDDYSYTGPDWWLDAYKNGGVWASGSSWKLTAGETGSLCMTIDPGLLANDLVLDLLFDDTADSVVKLQLLDENLVVVSSLVADLTSGTGEQVFKQYAIPLTACANASRISMVVEQNSGELNVYTSILYIDEDGDGLDADQELQVGTLDTNPDYDGDGLNDYSEVILSGSNPFLADTDGDGLSDAEELAFGSDPLNSDSDQDGLTDGIERDASVFAVISGQFTWDEAKADAEALGGHLATVTSEEEHYELVISIGAVRLESLQLWIGASDTEEEDVWQWITGEPFTYERWLPDQPGKSNGENYANYWLAARWNDCSGQTEMSYLIEFEDVLDPLNPDVDGDGLSDGDEVFIHHSCLSLADTDFDGISDGVEVAAGTNPALADTDGDGLSDSEEPALGLDPLNPDADGDGLLDGAESRFVLVPHVVTWSEARLDAERRGGHLVVVDSESVHAALVAQFGVMRSMAPWIGATDEAQEGIWKWITGEPVVYERWQLNQPDNSNDEDYASYWFGLYWNDSPANLLKPYIMEFEIAMDPLNPDSDGDGLSDGDEVNVYFTSPRVADTDGDGISDFDEIASGLDPCSADSDRDGLTDSAEASLGLDPLNPDFDGDGLRDGDELSITSTDPLQADSNGDGIQDLVRIETLSGADYAGSFARHFTSTWSNTPSSVVLFRVDTGSWISYTLDVQAPGIYHLGFQAQFDRAYEAHYTLAPYLKLKIDNHEVGRFLPNMPGNLPEYSLFTPWLSAGTHTFTITPCGAGYTGTFTIESVELSTITGNDADGDGIPDWMENHLGMGQDSDNDGISDFDEVNLYGTDTLNIDSDGDGLTDGDELEYGTDLLDEDSDNDGVFDGAEVHESRTNPLVAEFDGTVNNMVVVPGSQFTTNHTGDVQIQGTMAQIKPMRGSLEYVLVVPQSDVYRLAISAAHEWLTEESPSESRLEIYLDGLYVGTKVLDTASEIFEDILLFLPWTPQGQHTIEIVWDNYDDDCALLVQEVRLQELGGPDVGGKNNVKDWVEVYLNAVTGVGSMPESYVSPAGIEGDALYVAFARILNSEQGTPNVEVMQGAGDRWYANLPLDEDGVTEVDVSFQNGGIIRDISVEWVELDLSEHDGEELVIRAGDRVKFSVDNQPFTLNVGPDSYASTNGTPLIVAFDEAGTYAVGDGHVGVAVNVVAGNFPEESPACMPNRTRNWLCPDLPTNVVVEVDDTIELVQNIEISEGWETNALLQAPCPLLTLTPSKTLGEHWLVARLFEGGPILDHIRMDLFWGGAIDGYAYGVAHYDDMSVWEFTLTAKQYPAGVTFEIETVVAGVVFADDFGSSHTFTADDFNEQGELTYQLAIPRDVDTAACHTVKMYQDGVYIGTAYSAGDFVPGQ